MFSPESSVAQVPVLSEAVALHYLLKTDIQAGRPSVALCGASGKPASPVSAQHGHAVTSYTCPDCMLRYSLLGGGSTNA